MIGLGARLVAQEPPPPLSGLDRYIESSMTTWGIPGVSIAVIRRDTVIWARGFGVRKLGEPARVTPNTVFAIGSMTKSFTAALLGFLVDEKKISWDDHVPARLPGFQLSDSATTADVRIRDLLTHRTGLPSNNLLFWGSNLSRAEVVKRARFIPVQWPLRSHYEYQNIMYSAAGEVASAVTGSSWDDQVRTRIFAPLGMTRSLTGVQTIGSVTDAATPHATVGGRMQPIPWLDLDNAAAAGSIVSNVLDMSRYVRWHLRNGTFGGKRLMSEATMREMHSPQMTVQKDGFYGTLMPDATKISYGLGWFTHDYHGHQIIEHGGQTDGMHSTMTMIQDLDVGVVILTNSVLFAFPAAIAYRVFDAYLGRPPRDWSNEMRTKLRGGDIDASRQPVRPAAPVRPSISAGDLVGRYRNQLYGDATVTLASGRPMLTLLGRTVALESWTENTYRPTWRADDGLIQAMLPLVTFTRGGSGGVGVMRFDGVGDFVPTPSR